MLLEKSGQKVQWASTSDSLPKIIYNLFTRSIMNILRISLVVFIYICCFFEGGIRQFVSWFENSKLWKN